LVSESIVWFAIARRFKTRYVNDYLLRIYRASDAAEPRLSRLTAATAQGRLLFHKAVIEDHLDYATESPMLILKSLINYSRYSFTSGIGLRGQVSAVTPMGRKALVLAAVPIGLPSTCGIGGRRRLADAPRKIGSRFLARDQPGLATSQGASSRNVGEPMVDLGVQAPGFGGPVVPVVPAQVGPDRGVLVGMGLIVRAIQGERAVGEPPWVSWRLG